MLPEPLVLAELACAGILGKRNQGVFKVAKTFNFDCLISSLMQNPVNDQVKYLS